MRLVLRLALHCRDARCHRGIASHCAAETRPSTVGKVGDWRQGEPIHLLGVELSDRNLPGIKRASVVTASVATLQHYGTSVKPTSARQQRLKQQPAAPSVATPNRPYTDSSSPNGGISPSSAVRLTMSAALL